jgi:hypothetical protein
MDDLAGSNVQVWPVIMLVPLMRWWPRWWRALRGDLAESRAALARAQEDLAQAGSGSLSLRRG